MATGSSTSTGRQLRVLTFNVRMLPYFSNLRRARRIADVIKSVRPAYDIVCLQEVFCRRAREIFEDELAGTFPFIEPPSGGDRFRFDSGLFTASRFRTASRAFESYGLGGIFGADFLAEKGAVALELALDDDDPSARLGLFHTHVQSLDSYRPTRRRQIERLSRFIASTAGHENASLLLGDLNVAHEEEYDDVLQLLGRPRDVYREANPNEPGLTHPAKRPTRRLDYVLAYERSTGDPAHQWSVAGANVNPFGRRDLSDHLDVEARLELQSRGAKRHT